MAAALDGDRTLAEAAFFLDPLAGRGDFHRTEAMVAELLAGTAAWLPQFAGEPRPSIRPRPTVPRSPSHRATR